MGKLCLALAIKPHNTKLKLTKRRKGYTCEKMMKPTISCIITEEEAKISLAIAKKFSEHKNIYLVPVSTCCETGLHEICHSEPERFGVGELPGYSEDTLSSSQYYDEYMSFGEDGEKSRFLEKDIEVNGYSLWSYNLLPVYIRDLVAAKELAKKAIENHPELSKPFFEALRKEMGIEDKEMIFFANEKEICKALYSLI